MTYRIILLSSIITVFLISIPFSSKIKAQAQKPSTDEQTSNFYSTDDTDYLEREIFEMINRTRAENGLKILVWNEAAARAARQHSSNMANLGFFSHGDLDGKHVNERAEASGLRDWEMIGENIAYNSGFENPAARAFYGWMNSAGHRRNILRANWKETGVGIAVSASGKYFFTQVFVKR